MNLLTLTVCAEGINCTVTSHIYIRTKFTRDHKTPVKKHDCILAS